MGFRLTVYEFRALPHTELQLLPVNESYCGVALTVRYARSVACVGPSEDRKLRAFTHSRCSPSQ